MLRKLNLARERGFSHLVIILIVAATALLLLSKPLALILKPSSKSQDQLTNPVAQSDNQIKPVKTSIASDSASLNNLEKYLTVQAALLGVSDDLSLYFKDLTVDKTVSIEPSRSWIPASTIKAYVVLEAFRQRRVGLIDFNQTVEIKANNVVSTELETDDYPRLREGVKVTIAQLLGAMITQSDNIAYNTLLDVLDRRNINLALRNIGITETVVGEKLNLDDSQEATDLNVPGRQPNTTTVKDLAAYFDLLYNKKIPDSEEILDIFKKQKINNMIPAFLPQDTVVAHKTGDWAPIYHDGGVVYKPDDPFVLTVFTDSGDPAIVAKLAKVAYYRDAATVGKALSFNFPNFSKINRPTYALALSPQETAVLGESQSNSLDSFPKFTALDLGITSKDLNTTGLLGKNVKEAFITPGSIFYGIKKYFENHSIESAPKTSDKVKAIISASKDRISEVKTLLSKGDIAGADKLLKESEDNLSWATNLAKNDSSKDELMVEIKQVNDLHFAVLSDRAENLKDSNKEAFIDSVYSFYQKNHKEVAPAINNSAIANPTQQKPAVGIVTQISGNQATMKFDDGTTKQMVITDDTKVRNFQQQDYLDKNSVHEGDKIAVLGLTNSSSTIIPTFILRNVPNDLPNKHTGTVVEVNPGQSTLTILDKKGQAEIIKVSASTQIKSVDTNVSLEGIKAGSQVSVFGTTQELPSPTQEPGITSLPGINLITNMFGLGQPQNESQTPLATLVPVSSGLSSSGPSSSSTSSFSGSSSGGIVSTPSGVKSSSLPSPSSSAVFVQSSTSPSHPNGSFTPSGSKAPFSSVVPISSAVVVSSSVPTGNNKGAPKGPQLNATTVTVIGNSSGSKESKKPSGSNQGSKNHPKTQNSNSGRSDGSGKSSDKK